MGTRKDKMKQYEITFIVDEKGDGAPVAKAISDLDGKAKSTNEIGVKEFAYPIDGKQTGRYFSIEFEIEPASIEDMEKKLRQSKDVIRHLVIEALRPDKKVAKRSKKPEEKEEKDTSGEEAKEKEVPEKETEKKEEDKPKAKKAKPKKEKKEAKEKAKDKEEKEEMSSEELDKKLEELVKE